MLAWSSQILVIQSDLHRPLAQTRKSFKLSPFQVSTLTRKVDILRKATASPRGQEQRVQFAYVFDSMNLKLYSPGQGADNCIFVDFKVGGKSAQTCRLHGSEPQKHEAPNTVKTSFFVKTIGRSEH